MRLFFEDEEINAEALRKLADNRVGGSGKKLGDIMGFAGTFGFRMEDVWVSDPVEEALKGNPDFMGELADIISRFIKADWGLYGERTKIWGYNIEERYLGSDHEELGLYSTGCGSVYLYMNRDAGKTVFYFKDDKEAEDLLFGSYGEALADCISDDLTESE